MQRCGSMNIVSCIYFPLRTSLKLIPFLPFPNIGNSREWIFSIRAAQALYSGIFDVGSSAGLVS
jgi:hypothetical protein